MDSAFHLLYPRYSGTLTPTAPMAVRLWEIFSFSLFTFFSLIRVFACALRVAKVLSYHENPEQTGWMPVFIVEVAGNTCHIFGFVVSRTI